jgi:hypothetical protein
MHKKFSVKSCPEADRGTLCHYADSVSECVRWVERGIPHYIPKTWQVFERNPRGDGDYLLSTWYPANGDQEAHWEDEQ